MHPLPALSRLRSSELPRMNAQFRLMIAAVVASMAILAVMQAHAQEPPAPPALPVDEFTTKIRPILAKHCFRCHRGPEAQGGLNLAPIKTTEQALKRPNLWINVMTRVNLSEMPPQGSRELNQDHRNNLITWIEANRRVENDCHQLPTDANQRFFPGHVMSRRLTRSEYNNTMRDLFDADIRPADAFPSDGSGGEGFDNTGSTLFTSSVLLEQYLLAATRVLDAAGDSILVAIPSAELAPREAARANIAHYARRAFRRPVTDEEIERLLTQFDRGDARGDDFVASLKLSLKAILISPHFLFLVEPEPEEQGIYLLGHHEVAARLSYLLWNSMPDEELSRLADEGQLQRKSVLRKQVRRMLADPKARGLADSFATQWLGIGALGQTIRPDAERFPDFDADLAAAMRDEAVGFVETILREDRSLLELIDSDYAVLNDRLAEHYGLPAVEGDEFRKVSLEDRRRGGVLGLGAVLTSTSLPLRTSPVLRGKWILAEVLGSKVPPPPPDAGVLPEDDHHPEGLSLRQQLERHRTKPECAACHQRMDPLGFGLESFDAVGRWRDQFNGQPIDSTGTLPDGQSFNGPAELKQVLLTRRGEFLYNFSRKMLGYALGRDLSPFDDCVIREAVKSLEANEFRSSVLMEQIVLSYPFRHRYAKK